jgi:hypothetical protein
VFRRVGGELVMRTTFAVEPRSFAWQPGFKIKTYTARPLPPVAWRQVSFKPHHQMVRGGPSDLDHQTTNRRK